MHKEYARLLGLVDYWTRLTVETSITQRVMTKREAIEYMREFV